MSKQRPLRGRYRRILGYFARLFVQLWFFDVMLPRLGLRRLVARGRMRRLTRAAARFHVLAAELGGLMIKLGQFMSTRLDVLPPEVTEELAGLQDEAPEVPFSQIKPLAEAELMMPLSQAFESFDPTPVAAASLGQVHRAQLSPAEARDVGFRDVMVKVQRPGIEQVIDIDVTALRKVAGWASHLKAIAERTDMRGIVEEFARSSAEEIDYLHEASNAERFAQSFADDPTVSSPSVVWERTSRRLLTQSDVSAIKVDDITALTEQGIDPHEVAYAVADAYIKQVFEDGFFHADPHPGNLFVTPVPEAMVADVGRRWKLTFIDFGMMGEVPGDLRDQLKEVIIAIGLRDSQRLVRCMDDLHMLLPSADRSLLERAVGQLFDRFGGMSLAEMREVDPKEFINFGRQFRDLMREMPFQLPEDFLLLIRAASLMNGLCTALNPDYNLWDSVQPYADQLVTGDPAAQAKTILDEGRALLEVTLGLPRRLTRVLTMVERGQLSVEIPEIERQLSHIEVGVRRVVAAVLFVGLLIGGILLRSTDPLWGLIMMAASVVPLVWAVFGGLVRRFGM